jgi:putative addiction module CopG family antidote
MSHALKLTPEMQRFAEEQVDAGNFGSVDEVVHAAFALLRENAQRSMAVRSELEGIFSEMDAGSAIPTTDESFTRMVQEKAAKYSGQ